MFRGRKQNCAVVSQVHFHPRLDFEFVGEFGIHPRACCGERLQGRFGFEGAVDQHAAGGVRGFAAGLSALDQQHGSAALAQGDGEREADDASADDDYVPGSHSGIVKEGAVGALERAGEKRVQEDDSRGRGCIEWLT